jgi:hypothetical protein
VFYCEVKAGYAVFQPVKRAFHSHDTQGYCGCVNQQLPYAERFAVDYIPLKVVKDDGGYPVCTNCESAEIAISILSYKVVK